MGILAILVLWLAVDVLILVLWQRAMNGRRSGPPSVTWPQADEPREPTVTVSMARKINLGNFESADAFVSISGVRADMTEEELEPLLETGKLAWDMVRAALAERVRDMRSES